MPHSPCSGFLLAIAALLPNPTASAQDSQQAAVAKKLVRVFGEPLRGHGHGITSVRYSPDGKQVLTAGWSGKLRTWSAANGKQALEIAAHQDCVHFAGYYDGGSKIVSLGADRSVAFFDAKTGAELGRIRELPEKFQGRMQYHSCQFTADGKRLLVENPTYKATGILCIDLERRAMAEPLPLPGDPIARFALSPDGRYLALVEKGLGLAVSLHLYDLTAKATVLREQAPYPNALLFSADGSRLYALGANTWQIRNGKTGAIESQQDSLVDTPRGVAASADGNVLYVGSSISGVLVGVDLAAGKVLFRWPEFVSEVLGVALSPDGKTVAAGSLDGTLRFFDAKNGNEQLTTKGHHTRVNAVGLSAGGDKMVTGSYDSEVLLWDLAKSKQIGRNREHEGCVIRAGYNANGQAWSVGQDLQLEIIDAASGKTVKTVELAPRDTKASGIAATADGAFLLVSQVVKDDGHVTGKQVLLDLATGDVRGEYATERPFGDCSLSPDGKRMAVDLGDQLALWSVGAKAPDFVFAEPETSYCSFALVASDTVVSGDMDGKVVLWKQGTEKPTKIVAASAHEDLVRDLIVSADGARIFVALEEGVVIYDAQLKELARITAFDSSPVSLGTNRDGSRLLCGMSDSTAMLWSIDKIVH